MELFSPFLGSALANYIVNNTKPGNSIAIYEIGGGTGTLARDVLRWLGTHHPTQPCQYTCIEISPVLAAIQEQRVLERLQNKNNSKNKQTSNYTDAESVSFRVVQGDATDQDTFSSIITTTTTNTPKGHIHTDSNKNLTHFVVAMEVLDNLPHDRVWREGPGGPWHETWVKSVDHEARYEELVRPVEDEYILRCLQAWERVVGEQPSPPAPGTPTAAFSDQLHDGSATLHEKHTFMSRMILRALSAALGDAVYLPTGALKLFDTLHAGFQARGTTDYHIIAADFDFLPETVIDGWGAPLVSTTVGGAAKDHGTVLVPPGQADIFFPSNFELLGLLFEHSRACCCQVDRGGSRSSGGEMAVASSSLPRVTKAREFFKEWASQEDEKKRQCRDGYDPLLDDYSNTSFLLT